ncbi:patatin-like phospholipase family protein [Psychroflexus sediminis]|uniref:NTE family protein n=1 Tax=Psychroflexus sediminis TaxID=470826 RepID=A0A1G7VZ03_9FLAO|nr:patatin-like phospholipase family protein [Psychroflexus sediminis]SDG65004.1 NTE family protein [Psychroflexus sediminis]
MKKVSLVLSGGGARGLAHIGVLEELEEQGFEIHSITGTSMGAVVGGIYAAGKMKAFKEWILKLDKIDVFNLVDFTLFKGGFIEGDKVFKELSGFIPDTQIQDLPIRFCATATDLISKKQVIFKEGSLYKAMRASIAIPNVITPLKHEESLLVDGGVINNIPIPHAPRNDRDVLIAVNVNADLPLPEKKEEKKEEKEEKKKGEEERSFYQNTIDKFNKNLNELFPEDDSNELSYFDIMNVSFEIMRNEMVKYTLEKHPPDILIETPRYSCEIYDFYKADELIEMGRKAALKALNDYKDDQ